MSALEVTGKYFAAICMDLQDKPRFGGIQVLASARRHVSCLRSDPVLFTAMGWMSVCSARNRLVTRDDAGVASAEQMSCIHASQLAVQWGPTMHHSASAASQPEVASCEARCQLAVPQWLKCLAACSGTIRSSMSVRGVRGRRSAPASCTRALAGCPHFPLFSTLCSPCQGGIRETPQRSSTHTPAHK